MSKLAARTLLAACLLATVTSCGSSGGDDKADPPAKTTTTTAAKRATTTTTAAVTTTTAGADDEEYDGTEIGVGDQIAADPLTTAGALGFPQSGGGAEYSYDESGFFMKVSDQETGWLAPIAADVDVPDDGVAVAANVRAASLDMSYSDRWGVTCDYHGTEGEFYAFVAQGDLDDHTRFTVQIVRHDGDGFHVLAEGTAQNGGSLINVGGACVPRDDGGVQLAMSLGDERVLGAVDEDGLDPGPVGVFFYSAEGGTGTRYSNFLVTEAELA